VCPTTLQRLVKLRDELGRGDEAFTIVFVTVDPERDGPKEVGSYASAFRAPIIGLTGSPAQVDRVKELYGIFSQKVPDESGGYTIDHTATAMLFDRNGQFFATVSPQEQDAPALAKLKRMTA
jgi:protein SCO1/2